MSKSRFFQFIIIMFALLLRFLWLDQFPPSLYTDEVNQGYNAYSILLTAHDEHGILLPVSLRSFGDWKPPLSTYLMIPFVAFFGLNEYSVRLPSVLLGIGTIILSFYLVKELFSSQSTTSSKSRSALPSTKLALLTSFFLAISPWHILQSRAAMLVMISLFFLESGVYLFLKAKDKPKLLLLSAVSFALSIYAYYGMRVITPLIVMYLIYSFRRAVWFSKKELLISALLSFILLFPLVLALFNNPDVIVGRAKTLSVFYDQGVKLRQWELITQDGINYPTVLARFFHNNIYMYGRDIIRRYLSHFDGQFLFLVGDQSQPFQIPNTGILYLLDGIFIIPGLVFLYKNKPRQRITRNLIIFWLLVSFIPAAFTFMTPSANRTFNSVIPFAVFSSLGVVYLAKVIGRNKFIYLAIAVLYSLSFVSFLKQYFIILPKDYADWWGYKWKATSQYLSSISENYDNIIFLNQNEMAYIYILFYSQYDPSRYQKNAIRDYIPDNVGFEHVDSFGKYIFYRNIRWQDIKNSLLPNSLYITSSKDVSDDNYIKAIYNPKGEMIIKFFESKRERI